jgi:hypothetical protein
LAELLSLTDTLSDFLRAATTRRFRFGEFDCGTFCADWMQLRHGVDPAAEWRGSYHTAFGLARLLKRRGGIVKHFDVCLSEAGTTRTTEPRRGDIAIVETAQGLTGGILAGECIALVAGHGVIVRHRSLTPLVAAWSI